MCASSLDASFREDCGTSCQCPGFPVLASVVARVSKLAGAQLCWFAEHEFLRSRSYVGAGRTLVLVRGCPNWLYPPAGSSSAEGVAHLCWFEVCRTACTGARMCAAVPKSPDCVDVEPVRCALRADPLRGRAGSREFVARSCRSSEFLLEPCSRGAKSARVPQFKESPDCAHVEQVRSTLSDPPAACGEARVPRCL